jgi:hypothetical protein
MRSLATVDEQYYNLLFRAALVPLHAHSLANGSVSAATRKYLTPVIRTKKAVPIVLSLPRSYVSVARTSSKTNLAGFQTLDVERSVVAS